MMSKQERLDRVLTGLGKAKDIFEAEVSLEAAHIVPNDEYAIKLMDKSETLCQMMTDLNMQAREFVVDCEAYNANAFKNPANEYVKKRAERG